MVVGMIGERMKLVEAYLNLDMVEGCSQEEWEGFMNERMMKDMADPPTEEER